MLDLTDWQKKKYQNKDGTKAVILKIDAPGDQPIVGYLEYGGSNSITVCTWYLDGRFQRSGGEDSMDLVNAKTKREGWVNVYEKMRDNSIAFLSDAFSSEEEANRFQMHGRIACVRIEWEK